MRIVVLRDDGLGDMILTTPLARTLALGGHNVTVVGRGALAPTWELNPHASYNAIEDICPGWPSGWLSLSRWLQAERFDCILVPYHSRTLLLASAFSGVRKRYCQMGRYLGRMTGHRCLRSRIDSTPRYIADVWLDFARELGMVPIGSDPEIFLSDEEKQLVSDRLRAKANSGRQTVVVHPFHSGRICNLTVSTYEEIVVSLASNSDIHVVVTGSTDDARTWTPSRDFDAIENVTIACGDLSMREFFAVLGMADVTVVGSTGPMHVAAALNVPTVSPFCPHPAVGPELWGNPVEGSIELLAPRDKCERYHTQGALDCHFRDGPTAQSVVDAVTLCLDSLT